MKWQTQWDNTDKGRTYYKYHQDVTERNKNDFPTKFLSSTITSLRSGYTRLNYYKHLVNQIDSPNCTCGEPETVQHYLLECPNYDNDREKMRNDLFFATGSFRLDLDTILAIEKEDQFSPSRDIITSLLGDYITRTGRFNTLASTLPN